MLLKNGKADAAGSIYEGYLKLYPSSLEARLALAHIAIRRFDYAKARTQLETALVQHPGSPEVAASLGHLYHLWSRTPVGAPQNYQARAEEHFRQALATDPDSPLALTYLAEWQLDRDDMVSAERNLEKAMQLNRAFVPAYQGIVRFYIKARDLSRAKETALHALELDPLNAETYFLTAKLLGLANQPAEAVRYAEKSEQLDFGQLPERDFFLATQLEKLGELEKAAQYYETMTSYVPKQADVWQKLGEIYESLNRDEKSLSAYRQAIALNPAFLDNLLTQARLDTRQEKFSKALTAWRRLLKLKTGDDAVQAEALGAMASLHYLNYLYQPDQPDKYLGSDWQLFQTLSTDMSDPVRHLDAAKIRIALRRGLTPEIQRDLLNLTASTHDAAAGEAAFLLLDLNKTRERLDLVDGLSPEEYTRIADRLLLDGELLYSKVFYQRAYELKASPDIEQALKRIQAKQSLANQRLSEGNSFFQNKNYAEAALKYEEAKKIFPQWDTVYLRLGDTYEQLKKWPEAADAYAQAVALSPSLMDSEGFAKHYRKLQKRVK